MQQGTSPQVATSPRRTFKLSDAMTLVAAVAVSFSFFVWQVDGYRRHIVSIWDRWAGIITATPDGPNRSIYEASARSSRNREFLEAATSPNLLMTVTFPILLGFTPTLLVLRLRQPRPSWRELMVRPGAVACAGGTIAVYLAFLLAGYAGGSWPALSLVVVPAAWATLAAGGWWRSEPSWIDRAGRGVGILWIATAAYACWWTWASFN